MRAPTLCSCLRAPPTRYNHSLSAVLSNPKLASPTRLPVVLVDRSAMPDELPAPWELRNDNPRVVGDSCVLNASHDDDVVLYRKILRGNGSVAGVYELVPYTGPLQPTPESNETSRGTSENDDPELGSVERRWLRDCGDYLFDWAEKARNPLVKHLTSRNAKDIVKIALGVRRDQILQPLGIPHGPQPLSSALVVVLTDFDDTLSREWREYETECVAATRYASYAYRARAGSRSRNITYSVMNVAYLPTMVQRLSSYFGTQIRASPANRNYSLSQVPHLRPRCHMLLWAVHNGTLSVRYIVAPPPAQRGRSTRAVGKLAAQHPPLLIPLLARMTVLNCSVWPVRFEVSNQTYFAHDVKSVHQTNPVEEGPRNATSIGNFLFRFAPAKCQFADIRDGEEALLFVTQSSCGLSVRMRSVLALLNASVLHYFGIRFIEMSVRLTNATTPMQHLLDRTLNTAPHLLFLNQSTVVAYRGSVFTHQALLAFVASYTSRSSQQGSYFSFSRAPVTAGWAIVQEAALLVQLTAERLLTAPQRMPKFRSDTNGCRLETTAATEALVSLSKREKNIVKYRRTVFRGEGNSTVPTAWIRSILQTARHPLIYAKMLQGCPMVDFR